MNNKPTTGATTSGERIAKVMARVGLCSRRQAEGWISEGRVKVNGKTLNSPAFNVMPSDTVLVDNVALPNREPTRMWLYHKPSGRMVTENDPDGRPTIFDDFANSNLPRIVTVGRLDFNTEGLLLLTNDGGLKRVLELPSTGWVRRYRVRAFGNIDQAALDKLKNGTTIDGVKYGQIDAALERVQGRNVWLLVGLREGKNREIKVVLGALGLEVNRLIRVSYGPFQLGDLPVGAIQEVRRKILRDQLGKKLVDASGANFDEIATSRPVLNPKTRFGKKGAAANKTPQRPAPDRALVNAPFYKQNERKAQSADERNSNERPHRDSAERPRRDSNERPRRDGAERKPAASGGERQKRVFFGEGRTENYQPRPKRGDKFDKGDKGGKGGKDERFNKGDKRGRSDEQGKGERKNFGDKPRRGPPRKSGNQPKRRI